MKDLIAAGFKIERLRADYFVPILVDKNGYEFFRCSTCVCADQAASAATRGGSRPLPYLGMSGLVAGEVVEMDDRTCNVSPHSWGWQHHGWTHGMLDRMIGAHA